MTERAYQVVMSFKVRPAAGVTPATMRAEIAQVTERELEEVIGYIIGGLDVAVREVGSGGGSSIMEGEGP